MEASAWRLVVRKGHSNIQALYLLHFILPPTTELSVWDRWVSLHFILTTTLQSKLHYTDCIYWSMITNDP